ncbi:CheY-like receiver [Methyloglobulus morosus KoM1]|uniref:CheY-like receiver n=1 Tax=Methyloglobulus morosus KoM1 TaxID=1116472 RepID=V5DWF8_9GAMM|nr:response regulator [Methyloglobulus morosus]ESS71676.1 CheY-like receiver [Methyloglobulus morosus KoM1]
MILWLDDDNDSSLMGYLDEIRDNNYLVKRSQTPDEFFNDLNKNYRNVQLIIMDIMIPTGNKITPEESKSGLITGQCVINKIKQDNLTTNIPILILTVVERQEANTWATERNIPYLIKSKTFVDELLTQIKRIIEG